MRAFAITGIETASWISAIFVGSAMRATPPAARMSAGTRSSAITAAAPASSAIRAWSAVTTSMITPPLSISARPLFTRKVPVSIDNSGYGPAKRPARPGASRPPLLLPGALRGLPWVRGRSSRPHGTARRRRCRQTLHRA